jgi:hypothetical protein
MTSRKMGEKKGKEEKKVGLFSFFLLMLQLDKH